jgi:hypothetical protein
MMVLCFNLTFQRKFVKLWITDRELIPVHLRRSLVFHYSLLLSLLAVFSTYSQDTTHIVWEPPRLIVADSYLATWPDIIAMGDTAHLKWSPFVLFADNILSSFH